MLGGYVDCVWVDVWGFGEVEYVVGFLVFGECYYLVDDGIVVEVYDGVGVEVGGEF